MFCRVLTAKQCPSSCWSLTYTSWFGRASDSGWQGLHKFIQQSPYAVVLLRGAGYGFVAHGADAAHLQPLYQTPVEEGRQERHKKRSQTFHQTCDMISWFLSLILSRTLVEEVLRSFTHVFRLFLCEWISAISTSSNFLQYCRFPARSLHSQFWHSKIFLPTFLHPAFKYHCTYVILSFRAAMAQPTTSRMFTSPPTLSPTIIWAND